MLRATPDYHNVRFNLACTLARAGNLAEAAKEIETLWERDLPNYGPRFDTDEDLAALREGEHGASLAAAREAITQAYEAHMESGAPVVFQTKFVQADGEYRRYAQAGVWVDAESRFVPMGPTRFEDAKAMQHPHVSTWFHAPRRTVLIASANSAAVDISTLSRIRLDVYRAPTGERIASRRLPPAVESEVFRMRLRPTPAGLRFDADYIDAGFVGARGEPEGPTLSMVADADTAISFDQRSVGGVEATPRELRIHDGEEVRVVPLPRLRVRRGEVAARADVMAVGSDSLVVLVSTHVDLGMEGRRPGPHALLHVDRATGELEELRRGHGVAVMRGDQGTVYVQSAEALVQIKADSEPVTLPRGLVLTPTG